MVGGPGRPMEQPGGDGEREEGLKGRKVGGSRARVDGPGSSPQLDSTFPVWKAGPAAGAHAGSSRYPGEPLIPSP